MARTSVREAPGARAWFALPPRDRALLLWLVDGGVVTASLATLLTYGQLRIAQRRLARMTEYGVLAGFWSANRQRPRGRYAYALTKPARSDFEREMWPEGRPKVEGVDTVSPVIHQLATLDLFAAFLAATGPAAETGLVAWLSERTLVRLVSSGSLRPDALAVIRTGSDHIVVFIERDLGTERGEVILAKLERYRGWYDGRVGEQVRTDEPLNVGIVVESRRRGGAILRALRDAKRSDRGTRVEPWVVTEPDLVADPFRAIWVSPAADALRTFELPAHWRDEKDPWPILAPGCLTEPDGFGPFSEDVLDAIPALASKRETHWR
jgi:hypothetical protein